MKDKIYKFFEKSVTSQKVLKRIALYLFLICILLGMIFFKLYQINENILLVSGNYSSSILTDTRNDKYKDVSEVFVEKETEEHISNVLPIYDDSLENNSKEENTTITNNESTTNNSNTETTIATTSNTGNKINFVINVSSNKIHYSDCSFVNRMKEENKKLTQLTKEELNDYLKNGYTLCSTCGG